MTGRPAAVTPAICPAIRFGVAPVRLSGWISPVPARAEPSGRVGASAIDATRTVRTAPFGNVVRLAAAEAVAVVALEDVGPGVLAVGAAEGRVAAAPEAVAGSDAIGVGDEVAGPVGVGAGPVAEGVAAGTVVLPVLAATGAAASAAAVGCPAVETGAPVAGFGTPGAAPADGVGPDVGVVAGVAVVAGWPGACGTLGDGGPDEVGTVGAEPAAGVPPGAGPGTTVAWMIRPTAKGTVGAGADDPVTTAGPAVDCGADGVPVGGFPRTVTCTTGGWAVVLRISIVTGVPARNNWASCERPTSSRTSP